MKGPASEIAAAAATRERSGAVLVAIDGRGGSGKSTLATALSDLCGAVVIHGDDFYRPMAAAERAALSPEEGYHLYFDWQRLRDQVVQPLAERRPTSYERYDWPSNTLAVGEAHHVSPVGMIIVEGVYTSRPEMRDFYDLVVYVDTSADEALRRLRERGDDHGPIDWESRWRLAEEHYVAATRPKEGADIVVSGSTPRRHES